MGDDARAGNGNLARRRLVPLPRPGRFHEMHGIARAQGSGGGIVPLCRPVGVRISIALIGRGKVAVPIGRSATGDEDRCEHCDDEVERFCFHEGIEALL